MAVLILVVVVFAIVVAVAMAVAVVVALTADRWEDDRGYDRLCYERFGHPDSMSAPANEVTS